MKEINEIWFLPLAFQDYTSLDKKGISEEKKRHLLTFDYTVAAHINLSLSSAIFRLP